MTDEIQRSRRIRRLLNSIRRASNELDDLWTDDLLNQRGRLECNTALNRLTHSWQILGMHLEAQDEKRAGGGR